MSDFEDEVLADLGRYRETENAVAEAFRNTVRYDFKWITEDGRVIDNPFQHFRLSDSKKSAAFRPTRIP